MLPEGRCLLEGRALFPAQWRGTSIAGGESLQTNHILIWVSDFTLIVEDG